MSTTTTLETTTTIWVSERTWTEPVQRLEQHLERAAVGVPETPAETGRRTVDERSEDLRRLADS